MHCSNAATAATSSTSSSASHYSSSRRHLSIPGGHAALVARGGDDCVFDVGQMDASGVPSAVDVDSSFASLFAQPNAALDDFDFPLEVYATAVEPLDLQKNPDREQLHKSPTSVSPSSSVVSTEASSTSGGQTDSDTIATVIAPQRIGASQRTNAMGQQRAITAPSLDPTEEELLEVRRRRNRESMRRVRLRKRDAKINTQQMVDHLEEKLRQLMDKNRHAAMQLATHVGGEDGQELAKSDPEKKPSYPELLSETASLSYENKYLRDDIKKYQVFAATMSRMLEEEAAEQKTRTEEDALSEDGEILRPLLLWLTPSDLQGIIDLAIHKMQDNKALIESLVRHPNYALGWSDQRCIEGLMARYLLQKTFPHESVESLARKTWETVVDIDKLAKVMRWANGMKVLYWLSDDAAVISRELNIPNPHGSEFSTKFRFTLLVFRAKIDNGYCIGTINLNIYGTTVDECLQKDIAFKNGVNAHTMYGWFFTKAKDKDIGEDLGCHVQLAGLTGNGTQLYAHNVLMEMVTVVLLWENLFVDSIRLLKL
ncbi:hypothetical protein FI667_g8810, partial [Globisporangium splendens]